MIYWFPKRTCWKNVSRVYFTVDLVKCYVCRPLRGSVFRVPYPYLLDVLYSLSFLSCGVLPIKNIGEHLLLTGLADPLERKKKAERERWVLALDKSCTKRRACLSYFSVQQTRRHDTHTRPLTAFPATFPATSWLDQLSYCALVDGARRVSKHSTSSLLTVCTLHFDFCHAVSSQTSNRLLRCRLIYSSKFISLSLRYIYAYIYTYK